MSDTTGDRRQVRDDALAAIAANRHAPPRTDDYATFWGEVVFALGDMYDAGHRHAADGLVTHAARSQPALPNRPQGDAPRHPDPTLDALLDAGVWQVLYAAPENVRAPGIAHRPHTHVGQPTRTACGISRSGDGFQVVQARYARWHAVACHRCWPDAPLPGCRWMQDPKGVFWAVVPELAWQVIG